MSDSSNWLFQETNDGLKWTGFENNKTGDDYSLISIQNDDNGYPVVLLLKNSFYLKLTQSMSYTGGNLQNINEELVPGYWTKINCKLVLILNK